MTRLRPLLPILLLFAGAGCNRAADDGIEGNQAVTIDVPRARGNLAGATPMAERVAVIGLLNKRNGIVRDLQLRPGQAIRVKDVTVRLRACETSAPWETEQLTGAFVQMDVKRTDGRWVRRFSGWLYKETPSLNVVEDAVYDVWPKSCAMSWPAGPDAPATPGASSKRSSAKKSDGSSSAPSGEAAAPRAPRAAPTPGPAPEPLTPVEPSAADNDPT